MRRIVIGLTGFAVVALAAESRLIAQTASAQLTVTASVSKNCLITTAPVNFGAYDPVAANATAPLDGIGTVTVTCTKGAPAKVGLSVGGNAEGAVRRISGGAAAYLTYELYKDTGRATVWGDTLENCPRPRCRAGQEPAHVHGLRTRRCGTGRHGRQLHRHRRGDGEFLSRQRHETSPRSPPR